MANDNTSTTDSLSIEYPETGYDATPTWAELYGQAFEAIDDAVDARLTEEEAEDVVAGLVTEQGNISVTYDDANDQLQIDTSALNEEEVEDAVAALLASSDNLAWNYDDANDVLTISLSGPITGVQVGTSSNRQDVYGDTGDFNAVSADDLTITQLLSLSETAETISSGSIPYSGPFIEVSGEGGSADDLETISGGSNGDLVIIKPGGEDITVVDNAGGSGQILLNASTNFTLNNQTDRLMLQFDDDFGTWNEISSSDS